MATLREAVFKELAMFGARTRRSSPASARTLTGRSFSDSTRSAYEQDLACGKVGGVSDIGIVFAWWFTLGAALMIALPVTTAIMVGLGVAVSRARRLGHARRLAGLKWSTSVVAPFWLLGLGFGGWAVVSEIRNQIYEIRHYFTLDKAQEVDGIAFPAGTRVELDEDEALKAAELPAGATVMLRAAAWQGKLEFASPGHAANAAHGRITNGTLAASTASPAKWESG